MANTIRRRSCEILLDSVKGLGSKGYEIYSDKMHLAEITIRKWTERSKADLDDLPFEPSGRSNPFDRAADILRIMVTEGQTDLAVESINWLARELRGVFITNDQLDIVTGILEQAKTQELPKKKT